MLLAAAGVHLVGEYERGTHQLTLRQAANRTVAPSGTYVAITGTPNPDTQVSVGSEALFTLQGEPRLILYCPAGGECAQAVGRFEPRAFAGRLYDGQDAAIDQASKGALGPAIEQLAGSLGLPSGKDARVLRLGETLAGKKVLGWVALVLAGLCGAVAVALEVLVALGFLPRPPRVEGVLLP